MSWVLGPWLSQLWFPVEKSGAACIWEKVACTEHNECTMCSRHCTRGIVLTANLRHTKKQMLSDLLMKLVSGRTRVLIHVYLDSKMCAFSSVLLGSNLCVCVCLQKALGISRSKRWAYGRHRGGGIPSQLSPSPCPLIPHRWASSTLSPPDSGLRSARTMSYS